MQIGFFFSFPLHPHGSDGVQFYSRGGGVIAYSYSRETYNTYDFQRAGGGGGGVRIPCLLVCLRWFFTSSQKISVMLGLVFLG